MCRVARCRCFAASTRTFGQHRPVHAMLQAHPEHGDQRCCKRIPSMSIGDWMGMGVTSKGLTGDIKGLAGPEHSPIDRVDLHTARQRMQGPAGLHIVDAGGLLLHSHTESAFSHMRQSPQSLLLVACLCARASVNFPPAQIDRSLTSATFRF
jgi:hypothetical protein